jgi:hypothetical protein
VTVFSPGIPAEADDRLFGDRRRRLYRDPVQVNAIYADSVYELQYHQAAIIMQTSRRRIGLLLYLENIDPLFIAA